MPLWLARNGRKCAKRNGSEDVTALCAGPKPMIAFCNMRDPDVQGAV
jgi:hypothetical protein